MTTGRRSGTLSVIVPVLNEEGSVSVYSLDPSPYSNPRCSVHDRSIAREVPENWLTSTRRRSIIAIGVAMNPTDSTLDGSVDL